MNLFRVYADNIRMKKELRIRDIDELALVKKVERLEDEKAVLLEKLSEKIITSDEAIEQLVANYQPREIPKDFRVKGASVIIDERA